MLPLVLKHSKATDTRQISILFTSFFTQLDVIVTKCLHDDFLSDSLVLSLLCKIPLFTQNAFFLNKHSYLSVFNRDIFPIYLIYVVNLLRVCAKTFKSLVCVKFARITLRVCGNKPSSNFVAWGSPRVCGKNYPQNR